MVKRRRKKKKEKEEGKRRRWFGGDVDGCFFLAGAYDCFRERKMRAGTVFFR